MRLVGRAKRCEPQELSKWVADKLGLGSIFEIGLVPSKKEGLGLGLTRFAKCSFLVSPEVSKGVFAQATK